MWWCGPFGDLLDILSAIMFIAVSSVCIAGTIYLGVSIAKALGWI